MANIPPKHNPPSQRYPFENDIAELPRGAQRAIRNAFNAILDLQQASAVHSTNITKLQKTGTGGKPAVVPVADPPLFADPEIGITPIPTQGRGGTSPTGSFSPNTGATAATNSSYAQGAYIAGVNPQLGTTYIVQDSDYNGVVVFNTASAIAVTLNSAVGTNFACNVMNIGAGKITVTPTTGNVNGAGTVTLQGGAFTTISFDGVNWWAMSFTGILPQTFTPVLHEFLTGYNALTGLFSAAQPAFSDISGTLTPAQLPTPTPTTLGGVESAGPTAHEWINQIDTSGVPHLSQPDFTDITGQITTAQLPSGLFTGTVALAKLTGGGANGSLTLVDGSVSAYTPPT